MAPAVKHELGERERLSPIQGRSEIPRFLNWRGSFGIGVEVGTHRAEYAYNLLRVWRCERLYCVDPYLRGYDKGDPASQGDRTKDRAKAEMVLRRFRKAELLIQTSSAAASRFNSSSLDFVYIDANHKAEFVAQDLRAWWPKLKPRGILAGHDIVSPGNLGKGYDRQIRPTVNAFAEEVGELVYLIKDSHSNWSYYLEKSS